MSRATKEKGTIKLTPTDHHTLVISLTRLPSNSSDEDKTQLVRWNLNKTGGWKKYHEITEDKCDDLIKLVNNKELGVETLTRVFNKKHEKIMYNSFGKISYKPGNKEASNKALRVLYEQKINCDNENLKDEINDNIHDCKS